ncbi:APC family permease [Aminipila luticellarii]|uniref:APC family permease n=1 Tax=Aminipila luticellarii TaxID=2507160 RepID=A0A410PWT8_9FIRM|nr:APC family permease [Aminipila luticellarii]QAT43375.1 APC family permease [Aminipila luticellarii]
MSEQITNADSGQHLKRVLKLKDLAIYGIAFMTPIAPAYIYGSASATTGGTLAMSYLIAMVAMLFTAASYGRMAGAFPVAGSTYSYTQKGINHHLGFFAGWAIYLDYVLVPLIVFITGALYANAAVPEVPYFVWVLIIAGVVTVVNCVGVQMAAKTNLVLVAVMGAIVMMFIVVCAKAVLGGAGEGTLISSRPFFNPGVTNVNVLVAGSALACFSFLGFDSITTMAEEAVHPKKDIGRAAIIACVAGGLIFVVQAYVAQLVWPDYTTFGSADTALFEVAQLAGGTVMSGLYTFAVILSTFTAGIAGQSSAARLMYGMGRDEVLPKKFFTYLHPKFQTPVLNILIMCVIGIAGSLLLNLTLVCELMNFGGLFGFMCVNLSVIVYFFFRQKERNVVKYLILPALGFIICFYLWLHLSKLSFIVGFSWLLIGLIFAAVSTKGFKIKPKIYEE